MTNTSNKKIGFTKVPNSILWNKSLRLEEKALLSILISNDPTQWNIYVSEIYSRSENSEGSQRSTLKSLVKKGYVTQFKFTDPITKQIKWQTKPYPDGDAHKYKYPSLEFPSDDIADMDIPGMGEQPLDNPPLVTNQINNTNGNSIKEDNINREEEKKKKGNNTIRESLGFREEIHVTDSDGGFKQTENNRTFDRIEFTPDMDEDLPL